MKLLCFNPGSGTLRYRLFDFCHQSDFEELDGGLIDGIQGPTVADAAAEICDKHSKIDVVGVRVVHGGTKYRQPTVVQDSVLEDLRSIVDWAPLHLPTDIDVIQAAQRSAGCPCVAVFDTDFHATLPEKAYRYPLPPGTDDLRRFGFHGLAHQFVSEAFRAAPEQFDHRQLTERLISVHFGGGASACAISNGQSVATTMGFTPMDGLMMSTRCGSIDPGIVLQLVRRGGSVEEVDELLNRKSGLLGVSGISDDTRDIIPAAQSGNNQARLALDMYGERVRQTIGAYTVVLGGCDAIVISGALVKDSAYFRTILLSGLECLGIRLDKNRISTAGDNQPARLSSDESSVTVAFIPAEEEQQMARAIQRGWKALNIK